MSKEQKTQILVFLLDHLWIVVLFFLGPSLSLLAYFFVHENSANPWYYIFLSQCILFIFLGWRWATTRKFYRILCNNKVGLETFLIQQPNSRLEQHYRTLAEKQYQAYIQELTKHQEKERQNRMLVYRWVHQIKTPVSVIRLLTEHRSDDEDFRKVKKSIEQIHHDLDHILNLYQLDAIENDVISEKVNINQMCTRCINELKQLFIVAGVYPKLLVDERFVVYSDEKWLRFVLYQLLTNAVKYSERNSYVEISAVLLDDCCELKVKDYGCGIEKQDIPRIFEMFFTGKNGRKYGESSGIGLHMVKKVLDHLGHEIKVDSIVGQGSEFTVRLQAFVKSNNTM
ncbi:MAG: sensor histidine kinase [Erysipelotrichaceae bacterium]